MMDIERIAWGAVFSIFVYAPTIRTPIGRSKESSDAARQSLLDSLDCDQVPNGKGAFGSLENPIPVNSAIGELKYLVKLRGIK